MKDKVLKGFVTRAIRENMSRRYFNSSSEKVLYNFNKNSEKIILCEGIFKALRLERYLKIRSCAMLGHDLTELQVEQLLSGKVRCVIVWPDLDKVGVQGAERTVGRLMRESRLTVMIAPVLKKPADEATPEALRDGLKRAQAANYSTVNKLFNLV